MADGDGATAAVEEEVRIGTRTGATIAGVLCRPGGGSTDGLDKGLPAVLLCQGLSGVKHLVLPEVAERLAAAGFASLRFDYLGYGDSDGDRGWIDPRLRVDDAHHALAWLLAHDATDERRVGVYGHSYGGPVAIHVAARDRRVRAVVSVSGPGDGADMLRSVRAAWDWIAFRRRVDEERARVARGGEPALVAVNDLFPFSPEFLAAYEKLKAAGGSSAMEKGVGQFFLGSVDAMADFHPEDAARRLAGTPLLVVHGLDDDAAAVETVEPVYRAAPGPKRLELIPGAGHNDLDAGPGLAHAVELATGWFKEHLG